jgi:hypothetical protein
MGWITSKIFSPVEGVEEDVERHCFAETDGRKLARRQDCGIHAARGTHGRTPGSR